MKKFKANYLITNYETGERERVMLADNGAAYSEEEWAACENADYEYNPETGWLFQGQPFSGTVREL